MSTIPSTHAWLVSSKRIGLLLSIALSMFIVVMLVLALSGSAQAAPDVTCSVPSGSYGTIQAAIADTNCDTINVASGSFPANVTIARSLTLNGAGLSSTTLNGGGSSRVITVTGASTTVTINNLSITNGDATTAPPAVFSVGRIAGGILVDANATLYLQNTRVYSNAARSSNATGSGFGGGIGVNDGSKLHATNVTVENNLGSAGANGGSGGGIAVLDSSVYLTDTTIYSNTASDRGPTFTGNGAGGGLYINGGTLSVYSSDILDNLAAYHASNSGVATGGGLSIKAGSQVNLRNNNWQGNIARGRNSEECPLTSCAGGTSEEGGGALAVDFSTGTALITITNDIFVANVANDVSTSLDNSGRGGAISLHTTNTGGSITATLAHVTMRGNVAARDASGSSDEGRGGGLFGRHATVNIDRATILSNYAALNGSGSGGGVYMREPLDNQYLRVTNSILADNKGVNTTGSGDGAQVFVDYTNIQANNAAYFIHTTLASYALNSLDALHFNGPAASDTLAITNTIVTSHTAGIENINVTGMATARYMLFFGNTEDQASGSTAFPDTTGWVSGNPLFVDPATGDYHIQAGSAAIAAGTNANLQYDIDGDDREAEVGYDIGADELAPELPVYPIYIPLILRN